MFYGAVRGRMEIVCQRENYVYWDFYVVFVLMNSGVDTYGGKLQIMCTYTCSQD
jgi:hypothetical protein